MKIKIPASAKSVLDILHAKGHEAYIVGGCVRDFILGRNPDDWDMTTSASPEEVKEIFRRTVDTGLAHGTVTVLIGGHSYEVTSYRTGEKPSKAGNESKESRKADANQVVTLAEDLLHRDFTMNAMAYNEEEGLIDLYGGMQDLQQKVIRGTGDAAARFREDPLRMLRAVRFAAQLGFAIDPAAKEAIKAQAEDLTGVSAERICTELTKLLCSPHPEMLVKAYELGLTKIFLPEFDLMMETEQVNPHHCFSVGMHTIGVVEHVPEDRILRYAAFFHDIAKPDVKWTDETGKDHFAGHDEVGKKKAVKIMRRLRMDRSSMDRIRDLVAYHDWFFKAEPAVVRKAVSVVGVDLFPYLLQLQYADVLAQSQYKKEEKLQRVMDAYKLYEQILIEKPCLTVKELAVTGKDLMEAGVAKGPALGAMLQKLLDLVLEEPSRNTREELLSQLNGISEQVISE